MNKHLAMILKTIGRAREKLQCIVQMGDTTYKAETFLWHDQGHAWKAGPGKNAWLKKQFSDRNFKSAHSVQEANSRLFLSDK